MRVSRHTVRVQRGHGVGDVEQPRVGALVLHVAADAGEDGDVAQGAADPTGADAVAHRLVDAVAGGHVDVDGHGGEAARGDRHDHEVRPLEGTALVGRGRHRGLGAQLVVRDAGDLPHLLERDGVDVLEDEVDPGQGREAEEVGDEFG